MLYVVIGEGLQNIPYFEKPVESLTKEEVKLIEKEIKKTGNYLKKYFDNVNVISEIQWV